MEKTDEIRALAKDIAALEDEDARHRIAGCIDRFRGLGR
jgi:hypothetical protein